MKHSRQGWLFSYLVAGVFLCVRQWEIISNVFWKRVWFALQVNPVLAFEQARFSFGGGIASSWWEKGRFVRYRWVPKSKCLYQTINKRKHTCERISPRKTIRFHLNEDTLGVLWVQRNLARCKGLQNWARVCTERWVFRNPSPTSLWLDCVIQEGISTLLETKETDWRCWFFYGSSQEFLRIDVWWLRCYEKVRILWFEAM